jgi:hypothetical protein
MVERQPVSWRRLATRHLLWLPLIPLAFALVFGTVGAFTLQSERALARDGVDAVAIVTSRDIRTRTDRDGNRTTTYLVGYRFRPTSDQVVQGQSSVSRAYYNGVTVGAEVPIRFLPENPGTAALEPGSMVLPLIFLAIAGVTMAGALGMGGYMLRNKLSILRAARHGEVREAEVIAHHVTNTQINGRTQYRFDWIDAARQPGQSGMMDYADLPAPGTVVRVYIDPRTGRGWSEFDF